MRILLCTKRDLPGCLFLNRLLPLLAGHELQVWLSDKTRPQEAADAVLAEIAFLERGLPIDLLFPLIDALPAGTPAATQLTFTGLAQQHGVAIDAVDGVNTPAGLARLRQFGPDLLISSRFSYIFHAAAIGMPRHGVVNVHPGDLPHYAGLFAPMRMVLDGASELCSSVHWIDQGIDTGPVLARHRQPLDRQRGLLGQISELYCLAIPTLLTLISELAAGTRPAGEEQDIRQRHYRSLPDAAELAAFGATGMRFWSADEYRATLQHFLPGTAAPELLNRLQDTHWRHWLQPLLAP